MKSTGEGARLHNKIKNNNFNNLAFFFFNFCDRLYRHSLYNLENTDFGNLKSKITINNKS